MKFKNDCTTSRTHRQDTSTGQLNMIKIISKTDSKYNTGNHPESEK